MEVEVVDPWVNPEEAQQEYGLAVNPNIPAQETYGAVVAAVAHQQFMQLSAEQWRQLLIPNGIILDLKGIVPRALNPLRM